MSENQHHNMENMVKLQLIAAADNNMGIGQGNVLPWKLPSEFQYFLSITTPPSGKRNVIIVGHTTWKTMGEVATRPFPAALNIVLSRHKSTIPLDVPDTIVCSSLDQAIDVIKKLNPFPHRVWLLGGSQVYKAGLQSSHFFRLYLTRIYHSYPCDTFFPQDFDEKYYVRVNDPQVPLGRQIDEADGVEFEVCVYERRKKVDVNEQN